MHMDVNRFIYIVKSHRAFNHPLWGKLASQKLTPRRLADFLTQMGAFCEASRQHGFLVEAMKAMKLTVPAEMVQRILDSEVGHDVDFARMSRQLLTGSKFTDCWHGDFIKKYDQLVPEVRLAYSMFTLRQLTSRDATLFNLGVMFVVELAAHQHIIPGEVAAFIDSGFYGLKLDDVRYLKDHAGEHGAEHDHEQTICTVIVNLEYKDSDAVDRGVNQFLECLEKFYDRLEMLID